MGIYVALETVSYYLPSWVNTEPLTVLSDLEWTEKNGKEYTYAEDGTSLGNNNLSWTSGTSKASFSSKSAYDSTNDYYYLSSEAFTLAGADKTSLKFTSSYSSSKWSESITYATGAATSTKEDDVTFSNSSSGSYSTSSSTSNTKVSYKDGLGTAITVSDTYSYKNSNTTEALTISYADANKLKLTGAINYTGSSDAEYNFTLKSLSLGAGSLSYTGSNSEYIEVSWGKMNIADLSADPSSLAMSVYDSLRGGASTDTSTDFPIADLIAYVQEYAYSGANTIKITSATGTTSSIDAGSGNDTVTGGAGDDTIVAGAGADKLTGGKGNDTFTISKSDFNFSSAKTVLADTIADFKYTETEQDTLDLDGFGDVEVYQTLALAKKAESTAEVIYESGTGKFWYNTDDTGALAGAMAFATIKGIPDTYWSV